MKKTLVKDLMSPVQVTVKRETSLPELVALMAEHSVRALPVVEEPGKLLGIVSETDLFLHEKCIPFSLEKVPTLLGQFVEAEEVERLEVTQKVTVGEVMSTRVVTIGENATVYEATILMHERHLSLLPVVEDGKLTGLLRRIHLLRRIYG
jgi:CBS domain-containing protein